MTVTITFLIVSLAAGWQADTVRAAFGRFASYQAFRVAEQTGPDAIQVSMEYIDGPGGTMALAYCKCWQGHERNRIVLDVAESWTRDRLMAVTMHELAHIVLRTWQHNERHLSILYPYPRVTRLDWQDMDRLVELYGQIKPRPMAEAGSWRP